MVQHSENGEALGPLAADLASAALALARRFAAGATLWCWAPAAPAHAQHVAVEFVHPVIMGKRALPSVAVTAGGDEGVGILRSLVRSGDAILVVGGASDAHVEAVMRRGPSWGAITLWVGSGDRPAPGAADHVLWREDDEALAGHDGRLVLVYHLLWELTHVCFEHPGLLTPGDEGAGPACTTCADEADVAEVVERRDDSATVRAAGRLLRIDTSLIDDVHAGDLVLVHAGAAISIVDEAR
ncbi:MAG: HupF/HypC family protein [Ilumatobacteraceae bacterium]|nr:HupF/HypC family protein [Ilumatobacteraceae bacterium]